MKKRLANFLLVTSLLAMPLPAFANDGMGNVGINGGGGAASVPGGGTPQSAMGDCLSGCMIQIPAGQARAYQPVRSGNSTTGGQGNPGPVGPGGTLGHVWLDDDGSIRISFS